MDSRGQSFSGLRFPDLTVGESPSSRFGELKNWWVYLFMVWWVFVGSSEIGRFSGSGIGGFFFFHPLFPASGLWVRIGSSSQLPVALAEVPFLWSYSREV